MKEALFTPPQPVILRADSFVPVSPPLATSVDSPWSLYSDPGTFLLIMLSFRLDLTLLLTIVNGHYFYVVNKHHGHAYLLSSGWLKSSLEQMRQVIDEGDVESASHKVDPVQSLCRPLYERGTEPLVGVSIFCDVFVGHTALLVLATGSVVAINLSVHTKLCDLHLVANHPLENNGSNATRSKLAQQLHKVADDEHLRYRIAQKFILEAAKGLSTLPNLEVTVTSEADRAAKVAPSLPEGKKQLLQVAGQLEASVVRPLEELHQNTLFHAQLVRQLYETQQEIVEGTPAARQQQSGSEPSLALGIRGLLSHIQQQQDQLQQRLRRLQEKDSQLRSLADDHFHLLTHLPAKVCSYVTYFHYFYSRLNEF